MAAASGQPQDTQTKAGATPQQRKLYMGLAAAGVLALLGGGLYFGGVIGGGGGGDPVTPATTGAANSATSVPPDSGVPGAGPVGVDPATGVTAATTTSTSAVGQPLQRFRPDPFQQAYFFPTPIPTLPPVVVLPSLSEIEPVFVPGIPGGNAELQKPLNLPQVRITRLDEGVRRPSGAFPPRRSLGGAGGAAAGVPEQSYDKRLSGVVISDGVRAILETQGPNGPVSHVVQPGDEVEGITVLNIQRFNDGNRTVTRMLIRENGEERIVELRAGVPITPVGGTGGIGGPGGAGEQFGAPDG